MRLINVYMVVTCIEKKEEVFSSLFSFVLACDFAVWYVELTEEISYLFDARFISLTALTNFSILFLHNFFLPFILYNEKC